MESSLVCRIVAEWRLVYLCVKSEVGGALFGKGRHALFLVGKREGAVEAAPLEAQPLPLRQLVRGVDTLLGEARSKKS